LRSRELQQQMYEVRDASTPQRVLLAAFGAACVAIACWLLFGGGIETVGSWMGLNWKPGDVGRRACLAAALSIYYVRILFAEFVFLKRGVIGARSSRLRLGCFLGKPRTRACVLRCSWL
jgi:hypothetical protein